MTPARTRETLVMLMEALLSELDYYGDPTSAPAFFCRCLASIVRDLEDTQRELQ